jgi:glycosyltransferase 2 family protein
MNDLLKEFSNLALKFRCFEILMKTEAEQQKAMKWFTLRRILVPVIIGLFVTFWLIIKDIRHGYSLFEVTGGVVFWFACAVILQGIRDIAYMVRIRFLTDWQLTWRESFHVVMMWEFASSVTPSVVGGTAVALFILHREGFNAGRSTTIVMITAMLDELFYIMTVPVVLLWSGGSSFLEKTGYSAWGWGTREIFYVGYGFICILTIIIFTAVFVSPRGFKKVITSIFRIRFLKRWYDRAENAGDEIIAASSDMRSRPWHFWVKGWLITFFSWTARFMVVNALISGVSPVKDHMLLYSHQLIMWVILLISPTPGSSGAAEYFFPIFLGEFIQGSSPVLLALFWRLISYYPYLVAGSLILPFWLKRTALKRAKR